MNNVDTITINDNGKKQTLYTLLEIKYNKKKYIFYLKELKETLEKEDIYVGEITNNNQLIPVEKNMLSIFENILETTLNKIRNKNI